MTPRLRILVTGSSGHLGEALVRVLGSRGHHVVGLDIVASPSTTHVASIADRAAVRDAVDGVDAVLHTATLHKPHVGSHSKQDFIDVNVSGTLAVLEESVRAGVGRFVFTSSTTTFGRAMTPPAGAPASWITEDVVPVPRNIYGRPRRQRRTCVGCSRRITGSRLSCCGPRGSSRNRTTDRMFDRPTRTRI